MMKYNIITGLNIPMNCTTSSIAGNLEALGMNNRYFRKYLFPWIDTYMCV